MLQRALFGCLLPLLLAFQSYTAFQVCPGNNGTICAQRSTLSPYQNRVTLICNPGPGWGETEFFRTSDRRLLTNDFPPEVTNGLVYMVLQLSPSSQPTTEGVYVCRSKADNNKMSSNNETLYGKRVNERPLGSCFKLKCCIAQRIPRPWPTHLMKCECCEDRASHSNVPSM